MSATFKIIKKFIEVFLKIAGLLIYWSRYHWWTINGSDDYQYYIFDQKKGGACNRDYDRGRLLI